MNKLSRTIDTEKLAQSKERTMNFVMDQINVAPAKTHNFKSIFFRPVLIPAFVLLIAFVLIFSPNAIGPVDNSVTLNAMASEKVAEISYISSSFVVLQSTPYTNVAYFLDSSEQTAFETDTSKINLYFDTLKIFLEEDLLKDNISTTVLRGEEFDQLVEFTIEERLYKFYISIENELINGELHIGSSIFTVTGSYKETDDELEITLVSYQGTDYISIEYKSENKEESETKYQIQSNINGIEESKEVKLSFENNESKVEITEGDNEYLLKKEIEGNLYQYKLEYKIDGIDGSAIIIEELDELGNISYSYQIKEGNIEKEIKKDKPNYDYDENPGNGEDKTKKR